MALFKKHLLIFLFMLPVCLLHTGSFAQDMLSKTVSLDVKKKPLRDVLIMMGKQRGFYFSYNSNLIPNDSIVSISVHDKPIRSVLALLLGERCQYKETDNYIIIQPAEREKWFTISGHLVDGRTGEKVSEASVFEEQQLVSTLSDTNGYFVLRLKDREKYQAARIRVSKGFYKDTIITTGQGYDQELLIPFTPADYTLPGIEITPYSEVEQSWFGRHFFSSTLRKQSANLTRFFVDKPVQVSFTPGLGTHGKLSGQVTNTFSFNVLGGYSAGVNGFELGGLFNIDKKDVKYAQVGGISNIVSGNTEGVQIAGILNRVGGSVSGVQVSGISSIIRKNAEGVIIAGIASHVRGRLRGIQVAGIANFVNDNDSALHEKVIKGDSVFGMQLAGIFNRNASSTRGMQAAGIANIEDEDISGVQMAGIANLVNGDVHGLQMSGIVNKAKKVSGMQFGLINIADSVDGYCLGIINIVKKGYHKLTLCSNETFNMNAAYKAGNRKLYSILIVSYNMKPNEKAYSYGYGLGSEIKFNRAISLNTELTFHNVYLGDTANTPNLLRLQPAITVTPFKKFSIFTGPSLVFCTLMPKTSVEGYLSDISANAVQRYNSGGRTALWLGWQAGINIF